MLRKVLDSLGWIGLAAVLAALFMYSYDRVWEWRVQGLFYAGWALVAIWTATHLAGLRTALGSRAARYGGAAAAALLLVVGILALLNFLNFRHHRRWDLTENQLYSLSAQSRKVASGLDADVRAIGFFQDDAGAQAFEQLARQFRFESPRFQYEVVNPAEEPGRAAQYEIRSNGQIVVISGARQETIDNFDEEKITNAVIKVTREETKVVYFLQGHGEHDVNDTTALGFSAIREAVEKQNYLVKSYNLSQENALPEDADVLVSAGPRVNFFPNEIELLQQFLAGGGKLLLLVDPDNEFAMPEFLNPYGLSLDGRLVVDASGLGQFFGLGAGAPLAAEYADHPITGEMAGVMTVYPLAQSVEASESPLGYQTLGLVKTSPRSWAEADPEGEVQFDESEDRMGPLDLAAVATLAAAADGEAPPADEGAKPAPQAAPEAESSREARLVVFGDSDFASNGYLNRGANRDLFLMTIGWLAEERDLIAIGPRNQKDRRIELTARGFRLVFWGAVILLPVATLALGATVWFRRR